MKSMKKKAGAKVAEVAKAYNAIAHGFSKTRRSPWVEMLRLMGSLKDKVVLDAGCGNGRHLIEVAREASLVVGLDLSVGLLKIARAWARRLGLTNVMLVAGDLTSMPFRDDCFDASMCIATIHHVPTRALRLNAMLELARTLVRGGLALVSAWYRWQRRLSGRVLASAIMRIIGMVFEFGDTYMPWRSRGRVYKRFYHLFTLKEMEELVKVSGLELKELRIVAIGRRSWKNVVALAVKR